MVTHSKEYLAHTHVEIPGSNGTWGACPSLPTVLGEDIISTCRDLSRVLVTLGGATSHLLAVPSVRRFRLLARDAATGALAGASYWVRHPCGTWKPNGDIEPVTSCAYGQHIPQPARMMGLVA
ncbi:hypothetical protein AB0G74_12635 [Streptomyces sp. NPDC020875]|uniref:hypothetical protein n=1 Tax=Streptomyces sp. NPDC020875 TaxID=3154898 RepID=UPI0034013002